MSFFFTETSHKVKGISTNKMPLNSARKLGCKVCTLNKAKISSPKMLGEGVENPDYYFLFSKVNYEQDDEGSYMSGEDSEYLIANLDNKVLNKSRFNAIVNCFSRKILTELEIVCCRIRIEDDIWKAKPKIIIAVGEGALEWLLKEKSERYYAGKFIPVKVRDHECWMYCIHDPAWIISKHRIKTRKDKSTYIQETEWDGYFRGHLDALYSFLKKDKKPWIPAKALRTIQIEWVSEPTPENFNQVMKWLDYFEKVDYVALDIETNQLSPYKADSRMLSISVGTYDLTVAFPYQYRTGTWSKEQFKQLHERLYQYFMKAKRFVCHNAKFEQEWLGFIFGKEILKDWNKWECSQAQSYVINELMKTHSLDFLIRQYFGFNLKIIYNLDRKDLEKYPLKDILPYNGLDVKWTYALALEQEKLIDEPGLRQSYSDLKRSSAMLAITQINGVMPDNEVALQILNELQEKIEKINDKIKKLSDVKKYETRYGSFNYNSPNQVLVFLKQFCNLENESSSDESVLSQITHPIGKLLLENRALAKKKGTYIDPIFKHGDTVDGYIHAQFNHLFTSTGRLCVVKGTKIEIVRDLSKNPDGINIEDVKPGDWAYTFDENKNLTLNKVTWSGLTGHKKVMRIHWRAGGCNKKGYLDLTCNHPVRLVTGDYIRADELVVGDKVLSIYRSSLELVASTIRAHSTHRKSKIYWTGSKGGMADHLFIYTPSTYPNNHRIIKIEYLNELQDVYDLGVENTHNFIANGLCVSNSSSDPNLQNFPNRKGKEIRKVIRAPEGQWMVCSDYGQIEARLIAVASQDPVYCKMIWEDYDVHLEWAKKIAYEYPEIVGGEKYLDDPIRMKKFRGDVKNQWTFPQFYGSSIYNIARGMGIPVPTMLELNEEFWEVFGGIKKWQDWLVKFYKKYGYVETLMGHRRHGPLSFNEIINTPIQGTAGRLCINAMCKIQDAGIQTVIQVHDDVTSYVADKDLETSILTIAELMCDTSDYPWINVPIAVEMTYGKNWYEQEPVDTFKSTEYIDVPRRLHRNFDFYREFLL